MTHGRLQSLIARMERGHLGQQLIHFITGGPKPLLVVRCGQVAAPLVSITNLD